MSWLTNYPRATVALLVAAGVGVGYGFGRYSQPTKVKEVAERKLEEHHEERKVAESVRVEAPARVTTTTRTRPAPARKEPLPAGCPECPPIKEVVRVEERGQVVTAWGSESTQVTDTKAEERVERIVERDAPRLMLGATAAFQLVNGVPTPPAWGALVGYRLVGPVWALGQGEVGAGSASFRLGVAFTLF